MAVVSFQPLEPTMRGRVPAPQHRARIVRVGLLGLGNVGQAVVRALQASNDVLQARGLSFRVHAALVRNPERPRRCPPVPRITNDSDAFLRGRYDVVIEALGGTDPARMLVARLLGRGVAVVSANKALVAAHGDSLHRIARRRRAPFRYEASALAGVPFIGPFARRPLVGSLTGITGILNGTTNYVLTSVARDGVAVAEALRRAQELGLAEPDSALDMSGRDAADKLVLLLRECAGIAIDAASLEVSGLDSVEAPDLAAARALGGTIKPLVHARIHDAVRAFVGPAFVPAQHPLAAVDGALNGVCLDSRFIPGLFLSGPGAGPDITAATILDDAAEIAGERDLAERETWRTPSAMLPLRPADTPWFVRVASLNLKQVISILCDVGIAATRSIAGQEPCVLTSPADRARIDLAVAKFGAAGAGATSALRAIGDS
jgi:homoserine dehydrogenase